MVQKDMGLPQILLGKEYLVNDETYSLIKFIGKGKSAYSYLAESQKKLITVKIFHEEPIVYYNFTDKFQAELDAYEALNDRLPLPKLLAIDNSREWLAKEYVAGENAIDLVASNKITAEIWQQIFHISHKLESRGINIDYFPTNFIWTGKTLYYIDYEINPYNINYNWSNWGIFYWINSQGMNKYLATNESKFINDSQHVGIPIKEPFADTARQLSDLYSV